MGGVPDTKFLEFCNIFLQPALSFVVEEEHEFDKLLVHMNNMYIW